MAEPNRQHAVVLGGSIAGLMAARVLSDHFRQVTLIERDALPADLVHRRHVPQSHHIHALLAKGQEIMARLFPGFEEQVLSRGAWIGDPGERAILVAAGHRHCERTSGIKGILASRLLVEGTLRGYIRSSDRIAMSDGMEARGFLGDARRVTGLRVSDARGERDLPADLVLDCSGRGTRTPAWLASLGLDRPDEDEVRIDVKYRSRHFRLKG